MIIAISIVDKHKVDTKTPGAGHVGTIMFDVAVDASASHYDFLTVMCAPSVEEEVRQTYPLGKLLDAKMLAELGDVSNSDGVLIKQSKGKE